MTNITKNQKFRAWVVVAGCMLMQGIPFSVAQSIQPQFMSYVIERKGFTLSGFSLIFTIGAIVAGVSSPIIGKIYTKIKVKTFFTIGAILSGVGFFMFSMAEQLWQFYLIQAVCQVGTAIFSNIGIPLITTAWFDEGQKGKALGLAFAGGSFGNIFLQTITVTLLDSVGFTRSYAIFGAVSLLVGIPVSLFIIRMPKPDAPLVTATKQKIKPNKNKPPEDWGFTFSEVKKMKLFWVFAVGYVFMGLYVATTATQYPTYIKTMPTILEVSKYTGIVGSVFAVFSLFGNLIGGTLFDKIGIRKAMLIAGVLSGLATISLLLMPRYGRAFGYGFACLNGLSVYAYLISPSFIISSLFGQKEFGTILGIIQIFFAMGFAFGSVIFAKIVEVSGYTIGWVSTLIFSAIAYTLLVTATYLMRRRNKKAAG